MDYKYIEQLLERYWQCDTTTAEEDILKAFFSQEDVPAQLEKYRPLFAYGRMAAGECPLGDGFDARVLALTAGEPKRVKARRVSLWGGFAPLFKAAAVVAVVITLGNAAQFSMERDDSGTEDINYAAYKDTYDDPAVAYDKVENALELVSEGISKAENPDTAAAAAKASAGATAASADTMLDR